MLSDELRRPLSLTYCHEQNSKVISEKWHEDCWRLDVSGACDVSDECLQNAIVEVIRPLRSSEALITAQNIPKAIAGGYKEPRPHSLIRVCCFIGHSTTATQVAFKLVPIGAKSETLQPHRARRAEELTPRQPYGTENQALCAPKKTPPDISGALARISM